MGPISIWQALIVLAIVLLLICIRSRPWSRFAETTAGHERDFARVKSPKRLASWVAFVAVGLFGVLALASWIISSSA